MPGDPSPHPIAMTQPIPTAATATEYGYIRWRSTLTGAEGGGSVPVAKPAERVASLNARWPEIQHWFIPLVTIPSADA